MTVWVVCDVESRRTLICATRRRWCGVE